MLKVFIKLLNTFICFTRGFVNKKQRLDTHKIWRRTHCRKAMEMKVKVTYTLPRGSI